MCIDGKIERKFTYLVRNFYDYNIILFGDSKVSLYCLLIVGAYNYEKGIAILKHNDPLNAFCLTVMMLEKGFNVIVLQYYPHTFYKINIIKNLYDL